MVDTWPDLSQTKINELRPVFWKWRRQKNNNYWQFWGKNQNTYNEFIGNKLFRTAGIFSSSAEGTKALDAPGSFWTAAAPELQNHQQHTYINNKINEFSNQSNTILTK